MNEDAVRLDKYLWTVRLFKTRSEAADACNGGKVRVNGSPAKAAKALTPGDRLDVRKGPAVLSYRVLKLTTHRLGAQLVPEYAADESSEAEIAKLHAPIETLQFHREKGSGRPTKKDRRIIEAFLDEF